MPIQPENAAHQPCIVFHYTLEMPPFKKETMQVRQQARRFREALMKPLQLVGKLYSIWVGGSHKYLHPAYNCLPNWFVKFNRNRGQNALPLTLQFRGQACPTISTQLSMSHLSITLFYYFTTTECNVENTINLSGSIAQNSQ